MRKKPVFFYVMFVIIFFFCSSAAVYTVEAEDLWEDVFSLGMDLDMLWGEEETEDWGRSVCLEDLSISLRLEDFASIRSKDGYVYIYTMEDEKVPYLILGQYLGFSERQQEFLSLFTEKLARTYEGFSVTEEAHKIWIEDREFTRIAYEYQDNGHTVEDVRLFFTYYETICMLGGRQIPETGQLLPEGILEKTALSLFPYYDYGTDYDLWLNADNPYIDGRDTDSYAGESYWADEEKDLTLMVYLCGSNLESGYGSATKDLEEMMQSGFDADRIHLLVMNGGSEKWQMSFDPEETCISQLGGRGMRVVSRYEKKNMGDPGTLTELLRFGKEKFPARRYALILWDHGAGPLGGVCLDENFSPDRLTIQELSEAIEAAKMPGKLAWIGFDACLMSSVEIASAMAPYAEYMIASEETEPTSGWNYRFLSGLEKDESGAETGQRIIDAYFEGQENSKETLTLACTDLRMIDSVVSGMDDFFRPIGQAMNEESFMNLSDSVLDTVGFGKAVKGSGSRSYDLLDLDSLVRKYRAGEEADPLLDALSSAVVANRSNLEGAGGLSVYHPYNNKESYLESWKNEYPSMSLSEGYEDYLNHFGSILTGSELADWTSLITEQEGFGEEGDSFYSLRLTGAQQESLADAQLIILEKRYNREYEAQLAETEMSSEYEARYVPVCTESTAVAEDGLMTAACTNRTLYVTDEEGTPVLGPLYYTLSENGEEYYIKAKYEDQSGKEDYAIPAEVLFTCKRGEGDELQVVSCQVYDPLTEMYSNRIQAEEERYSILKFGSISLSLPAEEGVLPGIDQWESHEGYSVGNIELPMDWGLRFFDVQLNGNPRYAAFQITDLQQNTWCSPLVKIENPNTDVVEILPKQTTGEGYEFSMYAMRDSSPLDPGINVGVEFVNHTDEKRAWSFKYMVLNGTRTVNAGFFWETFMYFNPEPEEQKTSVVHISARDLTGLSEITSMDFVLSSRTSEGETVEIPVHLEVSGCDLTSFIDGEETVLAEYKDEDSTWQLTQCKATKKGGLTGTVHVYNDSDTEMKGDGAVLAEGIQADSNIVVCAAPHTDAVIRFEVSGSTLLSTGLSVSDRKYVPYLALDHVLERYGVRQVSNLNILMGGYRVNQSVHFSLQDPVILSENEYEMPEPGKILLEGGISAWLERILIADDGVGLRLRFVNDTDQDTVVQLDNRLFNGGIPADNDYPDLITLGAHSSAVVCTAIEVEEMSSFGWRRAVAEVGMTFTIGEITSGMARIILKEPVSFGISGGVFLSPEDVQIEPAALTADPSQEGPLSQTMLEEDLWKLSYLRIEPDGRITGCVQVDDAYIYYSRCCVMLNGVLFDESPFEIQFDPKKQTCTYFCANDAVGTDQYVSFGEGILLSESRLQTLGITEITEVTLILGQTFNDEEKTVSFHLDRPVPVPQNEEEKPPVMLTETLGLSRLLVWNDCIASLMINESEDPVVMEFIQVLQGGKKAYVYGEQIVRFEPGVNILVMGPVNPGDVLQDMEWVWRYPNLDEQKVRIRLEYPVTVTEEGGTLLSSGDISAEMIVMREVQE